MTKEKKLKPNLPSGFVDRKGNELILKDRITEIIKKNFQLYGYEQISTPSFEVSENIGKFLPDEDRPNSGVFVLPKTVTPLLLTRLASSESHVTI